MEIVIAKLKEVHDMLPEHGLEQRLLVIQIDRLERMYFDLMH